MHLVKDADSVSTQAGMHRFVVNLISRQGGPAEVRSCEVIGPHHRNRFTFPHRVTVEDVFVDHVAAGVARCLSSLSDTTEVVSLPSVAIEIPGLSLAVAHLITTKADDGALGIILRFKMLLGGVSHAFRPELGIEASVQDHSANTSALVLADLVMPLLDLCTAAESGHLTETPEFDRFVQTLVDRSCEVRFQAELIKRFVTNAEKVRVRPGRGLQQRTAPRLIDAAR